MQRSDRQQLVDVNELARAWGVAVDTARRWAREGKVPCIKTPGGEFRFPMSALPATGAGDAA